MILVSQNLSRHQKLDRLSCESSALVAGEAKNLHGTHRIGQKLAVMTNAFFLFKSLLLISILVQRSLASPEDAVDQQMDLEVEARMREDLEVAASELVANPTAESHKISVTGWPSTSPMWPSVHTADPVDANSSLWFNLVEPFIYADKPRPIDYGLLLAINKTINDQLKSRLKPMAVNLSFEYYFNYDAQKNTASPGIKIEVDRKQFRYLEPDGQTIKPRMWIKFNEKIIISDPLQFENHDWLKFSLVNRQSPSIVAIRRLKVEFMMQQARDSLELNPNQSASAVSKPQSTTDLSPTQSPEPKRVTGQQVVEIQTKAEPAPSQMPSIDIKQSNFEEIPEVQNDASIEESPPSNYNQPEQRPPLRENLQETQEEEQSAASDVLNHKIKPVVSTKKPWGANLWPGKRRKRDTGAAISATSDIGNAQNSIVLTCFDSSQCDWRADTNEDIQWSLARMPPSTSSVKSGYFYVSNQKKYGDSSKILRVSLNQTESATVADQNADHCINMAIYVTERTSLQVFKLTRNVSAELDSDLAWSKGNLLLSWAPTVASLLKPNSSVLARNSLPGSKLPAMEEERNGWTLETLCFGDFFVNSRDCGSGKCAFGFEMKAEQQTATTSGPSDTELLPTGGDRAAEAEQVVAISLMREFAENLPQRSSRSRWLEIWEREEVQPRSDWRFYPKLDYQINSNNISLLNLYDEARYSITSDWIKMDANLDFHAQFLVQPNNTTNRSSSLLLYESSEIFKIKISCKLVDSGYNSILSKSTIVDWNTGTNNTLTQFDLSFPIVNSVLNVSNQTQINREDEHLFKLMLEIVIDCHLLRPDSIGSKFLEAAATSYEFVLANVSLSDRCYPNPCQFGTCYQNGTALEDWNCQCDEKHRGRRCDFGRWCNIAHVTPWTPMNSTSKGQQPVVLKAPLQSNNQARQPKLVQESVARISGKDYCQRKLGLGSRCSDIDLPLNDNLYTEEDKTFTCSCLDDFYLSDDSKCRQAHLCNSVLCTAIGMSCDESKAFNRTQPCQCDERRDWFPDPADPAGRCIRRQCHDKERDCQFDAHICLPTLPGEKPICKCGPKFTLKVNDKGQKYCQSTACVLPTLNDCEQICLPNNKNVQHPYTCACHPGYVLDSDGHSCRAQKSNQVARCKPLCHGENQICTEAGCKCKQGYIGEGAVVVQQAADRTRQPYNSTYFDYTQSVRCLNICELTYAENKEAFEQVESVCPLGLCDPNTFQCRCSDPSSSALINTKYEPIYLNSSEPESEDARKRVSPLCHLRRVCEPESSSYRICSSRGAICVPDYTKAAMFDCVCPPSTEKKFYGQGTSSEFVCEPKCGLKKYDCLRRQAVCKLVDKDQVRCDCMPGLMFDQHDHKCYLAKYSYSFNLLIVNKYYEPEAKFHRLEYTNVTDLQNVSRLFDSSTTIESDPSLAQIDEQSQILPQFSKTTQPNFKSIFIAEYNQCNITQVVPKSVIEDPYEHDIESFLGYIDQCNVKIHQNVRSYHLNSRLSEDLRQSLRQHLRDFTVTTSNDTCVETDITGMYLNCTIYLQSNEPIQTEIIDYVFNDCDKNGHDGKFCWIKPRLLLKKSEKVLASGTANLTGPADKRLYIKQIVPCEVDNFCGPDAYSIRADDASSLCSCKCPQDIEVIDVKDLEPRRYEDDSLRINVKEVCAPRNLCLGNSSFCSTKVGSTCQYDIRSGSTCKCVYPSYENQDGRCIEVAFSLLDNTLIVIIVVLATALIVSFAINLTAAIKSKRMFGRSKQYPMNEFPSSRQLNRSTGMPNPIFSND